MDGGTGKRDRQKYGIYMEATMLDRVAEANHKSSEELRKMKAEVDSESEKHHVLVKETKVPDSWKLSLVHSVVACSSKTRQGYRCAHAFAICRLWKLLWRAWRPLTRTRWKKTPCSKLWAGPLWRAQGQRLIAWSSSLMFLHHKPAPWLRLNWRKLWRSWSSLRITSSNR